MTNDTLDVYKRLEKVLSDEIKLYRSMLDLVRKEKEVLISANLESLAELNRNKEALIARVRTLERARERISKDLGERIKVEGEAPRLLEIAAKLNLPYSAKMRSIHATLELLITRIREINKTNEELVEATLKTINGALNVVKDAIAPKATYAATGGIKKSEVAGSFVSKEA